MQTTTTPPTMKAKASSKVPTRKAATAAPRAGQRHTPRQLKTVRAPRIHPAELEALEPIHLRAAGLDVGASQNDVAVPAPRVPAGPATVRAWGVFTAELDATVGWLKEGGSTPVALDATGLDWMALYDKLEAVGMEGGWVEPYSVQPGPGRQSDGRDGQWLQPRHTDGLWRGRFRPDAPLRRRRGLPRPRLALVPAGAACHAAALL